MTGIKKITGLAGGCTFMLDLLNEVLSQCTTCPVQVSNRYEGIDVLAQTKEWNMHLSFEF